MNFIRPAAISDETIVPCCPVGSFTNVIVFVTVSTLHNIRSPSSIRLFLFIKKKFPRSRKIHFPKLRFDLIPFLLV